ncbi:MAG: glycoside hydrolase family 55 protein [Gallionellaceae bacterium]|nr:glycoside hydrolase family 55 protein [Gallionellaceae bacterium]
MQQKLKPHISTIIPKRLTTQYGAAIWQVVYDKVSIEAGRILLCLLGIVGAQYSSYSLAGSLLPVIFNAPLSVRPGDIVGLQGESFGNDPTVTLEGAGGEIPSSLPLVNKFGTGWVSFRIPEAATGPLVVRISNGQGVSAPIRLNAARAYHLDALQIVPSGVFRIFGRNLLLPGFIPGVIVDGLPASVDVGASDEHMLVVSAPQGLQATGRAVIAVDNGNGSGSSILDRRIEVVAGIAGDPFALGVGWAAGFSPIASKVINAASDFRLKRKVACNGVVDDTAAIQSAMDMISASGGGVLQLPRGNCRLAGSVKLKSRVVLQGAGKDQTTLSYEANYPLWGRGLYLSGVRELTLTNTRGRIESSLLQNSSRVFIQNVKFVLGGGIQMFLSDNRNFVVTGSDFIQPRNPDDNGPYVLSGCGGLVFTGNTTTFANGSPTFARVHDAYIANNRFTRDARNNQNSTGVIHGFVMDFSYRIAVVGNIFDVLGGPITNKTRNDGETLLTEGGGGRRTESLGTVSAATATTLYDPGNTINVMPFFLGGIPENYGVAIVGGKGAGQSREVTAYSAGTLTVDRAWDIIPDSTSHYATFVWGLEKSLIKGNSLAQNPRGIWLYQTALREVDVVGNTINEGGGIYLRSAQKFKDKLFVPMYGVRIANNTITNMSRNWPSYINATFVRMDAYDFGIGTIGLEIRENIVKANRPNLLSTTQEPLGAEGYTNMMRVEAEYQNQSSQTRLLGTIFQKNTCIDCDAGITVREGARGTVQDGNSIIASPH